MGNAASEYLLEEEALSRFSKEEIRLLERGFRRLSTVQDSAEAKPRSLFLQSRKKGASSRDVSAKKPAPAPAQSPVPAQSESTFGSYLLGWMGPLERICGMDGEDFGESEEDDMFSEDEEHLKLPSPNTTPELYRSITASPVPAIAAEAQKDAEPQKGADGKAGKARPGDQPSGFAEEAAAKESPTPSGEDAAKAEDTSAATPGAATRPARSQLEESKSDPGEAAPDLDGLQMVRTDFIKGFLEELLPDMPTRIQAGIFSALDHTGNGKLSWEDFVCGMAVILRGTPLERLRFTFDVLDTQGTGILKREHLVTLLHLLQAAMPDLLQHLDVDSIVDKALELQGYESGETSEEEELSSRRSRMGKSYSSSTRDGAKSKASPVFGSRGAGRTRSASSEPPKHEPLGEEKVESTDSSEKSPVVGREASGKGSHPDTSSAGINSEAEWENSSVEGAEGNGIHITPESLGGERPYQTSNGFLSDGYASFTERRRPDVVRLERKRSERSWMSRRKRSRSRSRRRGTRTADGVNFEGFAHWAEGYFRSAALAEWTFGLKSELDKSMRLAQRHAFSSEKEARQAKRKHQEELVFEATSFSRSEAAAVVRSFERLERESSLKLLDYDTFASIFYKNQSTSLLRMPEVIVRRFFTAMDRDGNGAIDLMEFATGLSAACYDEGHIGLAFRLFDGRGLSRVTREDVEEVLSHSTMPQSEQIESSSDPAMKTPASKRFFRKRSSGSAHEERLARLVKAAVKHEDFRGSITSEGFEKWAKQEDLVLHWLRTMCLFSRTVLGIRPVSVQEEKEIVSAVFVPWRQARSTARKGDVWYALSVRWWLQWSQAVGVDGSTSAEVGSIDNREIIVGGEEELASDRRDSDDRSKEKRPRLRRDMLFYEVSEDFLRGWRRQQEDDDAGESVEEESRNEEQAADEDDVFTLLGTSETFEDSESYTDVAGPAKVLSSASFRDVSTANDDEVGCIFVSTPVWHALSCWYGGGPAVPRMVVRDDSGAARLEVHPLQLRARRVVSRTGEPLLTSRYINVSKVTTLRHLLQSLRKLYYVSEHAEVRLWHCAPQKLEAWKDQVHDSRARGDGRNPASLNVRTLSREDSFKRSSLDAAVGDAKDAAMAGPSGNAVEGGDTRLSVQNVDTVLAGAESPEAVESPSVAPKSRAESSYWTPSLRSKPLTPNQIIDRWPWEVAHDDEMEDYLGGRLEFVDGQEVMLEIKNGGVWPRSREYEKRYGSADSLGAAASAVKGPETDPAKHQAVATKSAAPQPPKAGEVGLLNLGNTCYFNTAIQCLSHTAFLRGYLLSDVYRYDINTGKEHMGLSGVVAVSFVRLLRQLWHQDGGGVLWKVVEPRHLKDVISKYNEQFRGYQQQDTQEVLSLLLGGLHEDLNRVRKKPFIEQPDSNRRKDEVVADEWWKNGLRRDWSIVTSTFSGQFKSCLYCPTCGHESARFETFTFLQLPLPEPKDRFITVTIFRRENYDIPLRVCAKVAETGTVKDLLKAIEGMAIATETADGFVAPKRRFSLPSSLTPGRKRDVQPIIRAEDLCLVEINPRGYVNRFVDASRPVRQIGATEMLYAYHMPRDPSPPELAPRSIFRSPRAKPAAQGKPVLNGDVLLTCVMRKRVFATYYFLQMFRPALSGAPFLLRTRPGITGEELYKTIFRYLRRYRNWVREPALPPSKASADDTDSFDGKSTTEEVHPDDMGFSLFYVARMGIGKRRPSKGEWFAGPRSDLIQPDDRPVVFDDIDNTIAVDFDDWSFLSGPDAARPQFEYSPLVSWKHRNHESVDDALQEQSKPVSLHSCLEHFCETEELQCFCSKCTRDAKGEYTERLQRKTLNLWAVPPVLIVHLKRFKQNARSSYKLQTDVSFPLDGLDLSMFLGGKTSDEPCSSAGFGEGEEEEAEEEENDAGDLPPLAQAEVSALPVAEVTGRENGETATPTGPEGEPGEAAREDQGDKEDAEEAEGEGQETPEDAVPVDDIPRSCSRANAMYDLYAVINHVGIMGAGHYFTHVKKDGTWLCFNDRRVSVVDADSIDSKAAYLLFYVRRDVAPFVAEENGFEHIFPSGPPSTGAADSAASEEAALEPERAQRSMKALHHAAKSVTDPLSSSSSRVLPEKAESKTPAATAKANAGQEELAAQDSKAADVLNYSDSEHASSEATREEAGVLLPLEGANLVEDSVGVVKPYPWTLSDTPVDEKMVLAQPFLRKLSGKSTSEWAWSQCSIS